MRLRHKKPLNPYKGQTNNDRSEFNDDDFRQQGSPHKKTVNTSADQIFKYARILSKFIKTINQDVQQYEAKANEKDDPEQHPNNNQRTINDPHNHRETVVAGKQQIKQQKQIPRLQQKIQVKEDNPTKTKPIAKKKQNPSPIANTKQNKYTPLQASPSHQLAPNKQTLQAKIQTQIRQKSPLPPKTPKPQGPKLNGAPSASSILQNPTNSQANPTAANLGINYQNSMLDYLSLQGGVPGMVPSPEMMSNLGMMGVNGMNGLTPMQMQLIMSYNNPQNFLYGRMSPGMGMGMMGMGVPNNQQFMYAPYRQNMKPIQNLFEQQLKVFKSVAVAGQQRTLKTVYPLKISAYHVSIAYRIYLDKLKREGQSLQSCEQVDPTRSARKIKSNAQQQPKINKDLPKKKK